VFVGVLVRLAVAFTEIPLPFGRLCNECWAQRLVIINCVANMTGHIGR
jgi:hypothetical protein